ncbi:hypothetical protein [Alcaligenes sp.]|uniref:hypothetical protein n=1 Tax=Alcaligenes sp. TaxID=512 RepID=UPI003D06E396
MQVQAPSHGLEAFYADRMERRDASGDAALREHFEQELNQARVMIQAQGIAVPPEGGTSPSAVPTPAAEQTAQPVGPQSTSPQPTGSSPTGSQPADAAPAGKPTGETPSAAMPPAAAPEGKPGVDKPERDLFDERLAQEAAAKPEASVSDGAGPNVIYITNDQNHEITVGKFRNLESTTEPSAQITLKPGETGALYYENGEAGIMTQADADGQFRPDASRLEYQSEADGSKRFPDISYIDGRNASILLTDGKDFNKGDSVSIAEDAPAEIVTTDSAGNRTIVGWYDGSTDQMQAGGKYMEDILGTNGAYLHPDDDRRAPGSNPMTATESNVLFARFGAP